MNEPILPTADNTPTSTATCGAVETLEQNVDRVNLHGKSVILVGTAHVSHASTELTERIIREHRPAAVAVELDAARLQALRDPERWKKTDIISVIRAGKVFFLMAQLMLAAFQRKLGKELNIKPGAEMLRAVEVAEELGIPIILADRDVKTTLKRTWAALSWWQKFKLILIGPAKVVSQEAIDPAEIEKLKESDMLESAMKELATQFPGVRSALIDERDQYLANALTESPAASIVAIVGAGHVPGMKRYLFEKIDKAALDTTPAPGIGGKIFGWGFLFVFIGFVIYGFFTAGSGAGVEMVTTWLWITAAGAGLGALLARAHPLSILAAAVTAPVTTLHPLLASGWFAGLTEAFLRKPTVADLEGILDDVTSVSGIFRNRVSRIILVVAFTNLLGSLAAFIAMGKIAYVAQFLGN